MPIIDLQFMEKIVQGDAEAFQFLKRLCYSCINSYTKDHDITEELVPLAVDKALDGLPNYRPLKGKGTIEANFKKWVKTIAYHVYLDHRERRKREITFSELANAMGLDDNDRQVMEADPESLAQMLGMEAYNRYPSRDNPLWDMAVKEVIDVIHGVEDVRKKTALLLKFIYGMTTAEIAEIMRENFDSIQTVIHRSTKELRSIFIKKGIDADYLDPGAWREKLTAGK